MQMVVAISSVNDNRSVFQVALVATVWAVGGGCRGYSLGLHRCCRRRIATQVALTATVRAVGGSCRGCSLGFHRCCCRRIATQVALIATARAFGSSCSGCSLGFHRCRRRTGDCGGVDRGGLFARIAAFAFRSRDPLAVARVVAHYVSVTKVVYLCRHPFATET